MEKCDFLILKKKGILWLDVAWELLLMLLLAIVCFGCCRSEMNQG